MRRFSVLVPVFFLIILTTSCGTTSNEYPSAFPEKWIMLTEAGDDQIIAEAEWGFERIELANESGKLSSITVSDGGGAERYAITEVQVMDAGFVFVIDASSSAEPITFFWNSREKNIGKWITPITSAVYVADQFKDNFQVQAYSESEIEGEDDSNGEEFVYVGADIFEATIAINFQNRNSGEIISFDPAEIDIDASSNEFYSSMPPESGGIYPTLVPNKESIYQPYTIEYHMEDRENSQADIIEKVPVIDQFRRLDIRSDTEQKTLVLLSRLPSEALDKTTDAISEKGLKDLLIKGSTSDWAMSFANKNKITIRSKNTASRITIVNYAYAKDESSFLAAHIENEGNTSITFWEESTTYPGKLTSVLSEDLLPPVEGNEFFGQDVGKPVPLNYQVNDKNDIVVSPNTFMNEDFKDLKLINETLYIWNGTGFDKKMVAKN